MYIPLRRAYVSLANIATNRVLPKYCDHIDSEFSEFLRVSDCDVDSYIQCKTTSWYIACYCCCVSIFLLYRRWALAQPPTYLTVLALSAEAGLVQLTETMQHAHPACIYEQRGHLRWPRSVKLYSEKHVWFPFPVFVHSPTSRESWIQIHSILGMRLSW